MRVAAKVSRMSAACRAYGVIAIVAAFSLSCRDAQGPTEAPPSQPRLSESYVNYSNTLPITSSYYPQYTMTGLPSFTDPTVVELTVSGQLLVASHSQTQTMNFDGPVGPKGALSSGQSSCHTNVTFIYVYSGSGYQWGPGACPAYPDTGKSYSDTILVRGDGRIERAIGFREYTNECYPAPRCHSYSGDQTFSVRVLPAGLKVVASKQMVTLNDWVTFTATADPDSLGGVKVPIKLTSWQWIPAGGGAGLTGQCYANTNPCSRQIKESGTMRVTAIVQGVEKTASVTVECRITTPASDSILNTPQVRRTFMNALAQSNPDSTPQSLKRKEIGGVVWQLSNGSFVAQIVDDPGANACGFRPQGGTAPPGATAAALFHTHPNRKNDPVYGCPPDPNTGEKFSQYPGDGLKPQKAGDKAAKGGGSPADWRYARDEYDPNTGIKIYSIDADGRVWRLDPQLSDPDEEPSLVPNPNNFRAFGSGPTSCHWVR